MTAPRRLDPANRWSAAIGYSRAVRAGDRVLVSGTTAAGDGAYAQAKAALAVIAWALRELGAGPEHVVRTRMYLADIERDWEAVGRAHAEMFGAHPPATTMVQVARLIDPALLVEIEAEAIAG